MYLMASKELYNLGWNSQEGEKLIMASRKKSVFSCLPWSLVLDFWPVPGIL